MARDSSPATAVPLLHEGKFTACVFFFLPLKAGEILLMEDLSTRRENRLRVSARDERIVALSRVECVSVCLNVFEWQPGDELRSTPPVCGMMLLGLRDDGGRRNRSLPCEDCQEI